MLSISIVWMCKVLLTLKQFSGFYSMKNLVKLPQNLKSSDIFQAIFDSAVVCQLFQAPYSTKYSKNFNLSKFSQALKTTILWYWSFLCHCIFQGLNQIMSDNTFKFN